MGIVDYRNMVVKTESIDSNNFDSLKSMWKLSNYYHVLGNRNLDNSTTQQTQTKLSLEHQQPSPLSSLHAMRQQDRENYYEEREKKWCKVEFEVEISVNNPIVSNVLDSVLEDVAKKQVEAFQKRCE